MASLSVSGLTCAKYAIYKMIKVSTRSKKIKGPEEDEYNLDLFDTFTEPSAEPETIMNMLSCRPQTLTEVTAKLCRPTC